jgi:hypothetical protein
MKTVPGVILAVALACISPVASPAQQQASTRHEPANEWRDDLAFLRAKLLAMHPDPFRKIGRAQFDAAADQLDRSFASLSREQSIVGIMRLVASLGDGHTSVLPGPQKRAGFHVLPLRFYLYGDDLYLDGADRSYSDGLGGRLLAINGIPAAVAIRRARDITPGDNPSTVNARLPSYIIVPEILAGLGIIPTNADNVSISLDMSGTIRTLQVKPVMPPEAHAPPNIRSSYSADWVDRGPATPPTWLRRAGKPYWFDYDPKAGTLYLQYNSCDSDPADPLPKFAQGLLRAVETRRPRRIIVDLRLNSGGEGFWNRYLLRALFRSDAAQHKGGFFVLIGRQTFSAGNMMAIELEKYTDAILVGEPSGGSVQGFGNHEPVFLPNSGLGVMIATKFYQNDGPNDDRPALLPALAVAITPADYGSGRDPVLNAALRYKTSDHKTAQTKP